MLKHEFAKKKLKKGKKSMLYISRYFKEIQKSIFVIKTMLKCFDWCMCMRNCHTFILSSLCFVPFLK